MKKISFVLLLTLLFLFTGCQSGSTSSNPKIKVEGIPSTLTVGDVVEFNVLISGYDNKEYEISCDKDFIVSIENNKITGLAIGSVTITIVSKMDSSLFSIHTVIVKEAITENFPCDVSINLNSDGSNFTGTLKLNENGNDVSYVVINTDEDSYKVYPNEMFCINSDNILNIVIHYGILKQVTIEKNQIKISYNGNNVIPNLTEEELRNLDVTISFWHSMSQNRSIILDEIIRGFNRKYPNIKVESRNLGGLDTLPNSIINGIRVGDHPTIAQVYPEHVTLYMSGNAVRELDSYKDHKTYGLSEAQLNDYIDNFYAEGKMYDGKGTLYSVPFLKSTEVLYFNATWFQEHGLLEKYNLGTIERINDVSTFVPNENAMLTWEDIEEIGKYYISLDEYKNRSDYEKLDYYALSYDTEYNLFITLTQQFGGQYTKLTGENSCEFAFDNVQSRQAMQWYLDAHKAGYFVTASRWNTDYSSDRFISGNVIMCIGTSAGCLYNDPNGRFVAGVLPYPQKEANIGKGVEGGELVIQQGTNVSLFKCENPYEELAGWLFIKYLTSWDPELSFEDQPTAMWSMIDGYLPILKSIINSEQYREFLNNRNLISDVHRVAISDLDNFFVPPIILNSQDARYEVQNLVCAILYGNVSIDEAYELALKNLVY